MRGIELPPVVAELTASLLHPNEHQSRVRDSPAHAAAVLVLLFPREGDIRFLLTDRPETLTRHPGQISLPGGKAEPGDGGLWHTAVREVEEELGIRAGALVALGQLEDYDMPVSGFRVTPFVAWGPDAPIVHANTHEVAAVIEVPLASLLDPGVVHEEIWRLHGDQYHVTFYRFAQWQVWGATARMLHDLACRLSGAERRIQEGPGSVRPLRSEK